MRDAAPRNQNLSQAKSLQSMHHCPLRNSPSQHSRDVLNTPPHQSMQHNVFSTPTSKDGSKTLGARNGASSTACRDSSHPAAGMLTTRTRDCDCTSAQAVQSGLLRYVLSIEAASICAALTSSLRSCCCLATCTLRMP